MNTNQTGLWQRLERFQLDDPQVAFPFTARLARENGWSRTFARRVADEYRRFAFLCVAAGHPCTPSEQVDQAWHLHLIYTRSYWDEFCRDALRQPLHHGPTRGGTEENGKYHDWYTRTLASYRQHFGEPPADIWPPAERRFGEDLRVERVNVGRHWVILKPRWWPLAKAATALAVGGLAVAGCRGAMLGYVPVLDWNGPDFLKFYVATFLAASAVLAVWLLRWDKAQEKRAEKLPPPADVYELAAATGGTERMAQTAIVSLANAGTFKLGGADGKQLQVAGPLPDTAHPVEQAVYAKLLGCETISAYGAMVEAADLPVLQETLSRQREADAAGREPSRLVLLPLALLAVIGVVKLLIGIQRDRPVGFLAVLLLGTVVVLIWVAGFLKRMRPWQKYVADSFCRRGTALRQEILHHTPWRHEGTGVALTTALYGVGALSGTLLSGYQPLLAPPLLRPAAGSGGGDSGCGSSGCSSSGCGSSGCGSSGCGGGGGGCGGCGGGGD